MAVRYEGVIYQCEKCKNIYSRWDDAKKCCEPKKCECGEIIKMHQTQCDNCWSIERQKIAKEAYEKAPKMTAKEYAEKFPNLGVFVDENYYCTVEDAIDANEGEDYVIKGSEETYCILSTENMIESALEDAYEDAEFAAEALAELEEFIAKWNENHRLLCYSETNLVILPDEEVNDETN